MKEKDAVVIFVRILVSDVCPAFFMNAYDQTPSNGFVWNMSQTCLTQSRLWQDQTWICLQHLDMLRCCR